MKVLRIRSDECSPRSQRNRFRNTDSPRADPSAMCLSAFSRDDEVDASYRFHVALKI